MEKIALIYEGSYLYWSGIVTTFAALTAIFGFLFLYMRSDEKISGAAVLVPLALVFSVLLSRMIHWYCYSETYVSFLVAMTDYHRGGFALIGAFGGCVLAAVVAGKLHLHTDLFRILDWMCLAGGAGIAVGRLGAFFGRADRGQLIDPSIGLPFGSPVMNVVSGEMEQRLATFMLQAIVTGVIVAILLIVYLRKGESNKSGDTTLLFLLCYSAAQVVLDSTRYDSMYFRSNGFVSIVQVMSALTLAAVIVIFSRRMVKQRGFDRRYILLWLTMAALIGVAGYMEYYVQRHGSEALFAYSVMSGCLLLVVALTIGTYLHEKVETVIKKLACGKRMTEFLHKIKK